MVVKYLSINFIVYLLYILRKIFLNYKNNLFFQVKNELNTGGILTDYTYNEDKLMYIPNDDKQNYHFCKIKL